MKKVFTIIAELEFYLMSDFWTSFGDPRVSEFLFMVSFRLPVAILILYFFSVYILAPILVCDHSHKIHQKPVSPKAYHHLYNMALIAFSGYIVYHNVLHYKTLLKTILDVQSPPNYADTSPGTTALLHQLYLFLLSRYAHLLKPVLAILRHQSVSSSTIYGIFSLACFGWMHYRCAGSVLPLLAITGVLLPLYDIAYHSCALLADLRPALKFNTTLKLLLIRMQLGIWFLLALHLFCYGLMQAVFCLQVAFIAKMVLYGGNIAVYITLFLLEFFVPYFN